MTSQLNDLQSQHIVDEVKKVDDKVTKNSTNILGFGSRLKQKEDTFNDLEREASFFRGNYYFNQQSYLICEPKTFSFKQTSSGITHWKSTGIDNYSVKTDLRGVANTSGVYPKFSGETRVSVKFSGNYVKENKVIKVIIFGADMSFNAYERNRQNEIYVLGRGEIQAVTTVGPTKGEATIYAGKLYKHNFTKPNEKLVCLYITMVIILIYLLMEVKN